MNRPALVLVSGKSRVLAKTFGFQRVVLLAARVSKKFGSGTMYDNVAPHAWSPHDFPHSEEEAKCCLKDQVSVNPSCRP
jgi:hypothetical protein